MRTLLLILALAAPLHADATIVLDAPTEAKVGQLVVLDASQSEADSFKWIAPDNIYPVDGGSKIIFSAMQAGTYQFTLAVAKEGTVDIVIHEITVKTPQPTDELVSKITVWSQEVQYAAKRDDLIKLSHSFGLVAARIESGELTSVAEILSATKKANHEAIGDNLSHWTPFFNNLNVELQRLANAGKLVTPEDHATLWRRIASALNGSA